MSLTQNEIFKKAKDIIGKSEQFARFIDVAEQPIAGSYVNIRIINAGSGTCRAELTVNPQGNLDTTMEGERMKRVLNRIREALQPEVDKAACEVACLLTNTPLDEMPVVKVEEPNRVLAGTLAVEANAEDEADDSEE